MRLKEINRETFRATIASNPEISSVPTVAVAIIRMFNNPNSTFHELARVIETDEELTGRILKIANSGYYSFNEKITAVSRAVVLLGWNAVKMITLGSTILAQMSEKNRQLYEHSVRTALIARFLGMEANFYKVEEIEVVGLLHDIGSFMLERYFHNHYLKIKQYVIDHGVPAYLAEREIIGVDHGAIGGWTLEEWDIPRNISTSVMWHHDFKPNTYHSRKTAVIHMADSLALAADYTGPSWEKVPEIREEALTTLGFTEFRVRDIVHEVMSIKPDSMLFNM